MLKNKLKIIAKIGTFFISSLVLFLCLVWLAIQSDAGRGYLITLLEKGLSRGQIYKIEIGNVHGTIPFDFHIDGIDVDDKFGGILSVRDFVFRWSPLPLFKGKIMIDEIRASEIRLNRILSNNNEKDLSSKATLLPWWLSWIQSIQIGDLRLSRCVMGEDIRGYEMIFSINGNISSLDSLDEGKGHVKIELIEGPKAFAEINYSMTGVRHWMELDATVQDMEGELINAFTGLKEIGPVNVTVKGEGPADKWKGSILADLEKMGHLKAQLVIKDLQDISVIGTGHLKSDYGMVPKEISDILQNDIIQTDFDLEYEHEDRLIINSFHLDTKIARSNVSGRFDFQGLDMDASFDLEMPDAGCFKGMMGKNMGGGLRATGSLKGPLDHPALTLSANLTTPMFDDFEAKKITSQILINSYGYSPSTFQKFNALIKSEVEGLKSGKGSFPMPLDRFQMNLEASMEKSGPVNIKTLEIRNKDLAMIFSGILNPEPEMIKGDFSIESLDTSWLSRVLDYNIDGSAHLKGSIETDLNSIDIQSEINGHMRSITPLPDFIIPIIGDGVKFNGKIDIEKTRYIKFHELSIISPVISSICNGSVDLERGYALSNIKVDIPRISDLSEAIKGKIEGPAKLDIGISGIYPDLKVQTIISGKDMNVGSAEFSKVLLNIEAENTLEKPHGKAWLEVLYNDKPAEASFDFNMVDEGINLAGLSITGYGAEFSGDVKIDPKGPVIIGNIEGRCNELAALPPVLGEKLMGNGLMRVILTKGETGQDASIQLIGRGLGGGFGNAKNLKVEAQVIDVLSSPRGRVDVELEGFKRDNLDLDLVNIQMQSNDNTVDFRFEAAGTSIERFELMADGTFNFSKDNAAIIIQDLKGAFGIYPVELLGPISLHKVNDKYSVEGARIRFGEGMILFSQGSIEPESINVDVKIEKIPLEIIGIAGITDISGIINGSLNLYGRPDVPEIEAAINVTHIKSLLEKYRDIPPADLNVKSEQKGNTLKTSIVLSGISEKPVEAHLDLPLRVSFLPASISLERQGALKGHVSSEIGIHQIMSFFYPGDDILNGRLVTDLKIDGNLQEPQVHGTIQLSDGVYENYQTGTIIKDIQVRMNIVNDKVTLEDAHAKDGSNGIITADGIFNLILSEHFPFKLTIDMKNCTLIQTDDMMVSASGWVSASGSMKKAAISGNIITERVDINIPDQLPAGVTELRVTEINHSDQGKTEKTGQVKKDSNFEMPYNLEIDAPGRIFIRGRGLDSEWKGQLQVKDKKGSMTLNGNITLVRGRYNFFGKPFSLSKGVITFTGSNPPSPGLDVVAEHGSSDMTTIIRITGSSSSPTISIQSDPPFPSDEILSRLLFNKGVGEITPFQALRLAQALNSLRGSGGGILNVFDRTRELIGVDQLDIRQSGETSDQTSVSVGKYVRDDVYIEMEKGIGTESDKLSVEIEVTPNITVESEIGSDKGGGAGINWKFDY